MPGITNLVKNLWLPQLRTLVRLLSYRMDTVTNCLLMFYLYILYAYIIITSQTLSEKMIFCCILIQRIIIDYHSEIKTIEYSVIYTILPPLKTQALSQKITVSIYSKTLFAGQNRGIVYIKP